jgi:hypothetical protein
MLVRRFVERSVDLVELHDVAKKKKAVTMAASAVALTSFSFLSKMQKCLSLKCLH